MTGELAIQLRKLAQTWKDAARKLEETADLVETINPGRDITAIIDSKPSKPPRDFSDLSIREAAYKVLEEADQPLSKEAVFKRMVQRGNKKAENYTDLHSLFSRKQNNFKSLGLGLWTIAGREGEFTLPVGLILGSSQEGDGEKKK